MKIGVKVTILIVIAVVGLAIVGVFGIRGIDGLNNMINYIGEVPVRNSNLANEVMEHFSVVRANTAMMIIDANNPESLKADLEKIEEAAGDMYAILDTLHNSASEQGKVFIKKIQDAVLESGHERKAMTDMVIAGDVAGASVIRSTTYARDAGAVTDAIDKYVTFASAQVHQAVEIDSTELAASTQMTMYIVIALVLVILIVVAVIVIRGITKGLKQAVEAVRKISEGDFDVDLETTSKDEIGILMDSSKDMVNAIKTCISAAEHIAKNVENGKLDSRADTKLVKGAYADMLSGVNGLIEAFYVPLQIIVVFVRDISNGIVPPKITNDFRGEFGELEIDMNNCIDTLAYIVTNVNRIGAEAREGILEHRVDVTKLQNAWNELVSGVNGILENADNIINDAGKTLSTMATGDLTPRITAAYKGKFGEMKDNINNLGDSLTDLISQLQAAIHTTASASAQISSTADTLAAATQEQSSQTDEVATAMEEMSRTVTDNANSATRTADVARNSGEVANNGGKVVQQTVIKMREIAAVVKQSAENIAKLGESSKKIGEIIVVIEDIASQTNLLSLNAAIEAARAGEQGRGFAVVADNVGKLAISTASATKEIGDMIKGIQDDTESAVKAMEKGTIEVQSGIELADNAGHSLQDILAGINELLDMVNQIAAASEQQSATSEQISKNVSSISKVSADSARNVEDVATTANELARMTDTLTSLVSQFKINVGGYDNNYLQSATVRHLV